MEIEARTLTRRLPIRMDQEMDDKVTKYAKKEGIPKAVWIRQAIAEKLSRTIQDE